MRCRPRCAAHLPATGRSPAAGRCPAAACSSGSSCRPASTAKRCCRARCARGVAFVPGAPFFAGDARANTLRLSFVTVDARGDRARHRRPRRRLADLHDEAAASLRRERPARRGGGAMTRFAFTQVDVFTATALRGNPLAVVHGADALDEARMQAFARWTNLSETTFLLAPTDAPPTTASASSRQAASCRSPAIRRSAAATRGCERGGRRATRRRGGAAVRGRPGAHSPRRRRRRIRRAAAGAQRRLGRRPRCRARRARRGARNCVAAQWLNERPELARPAARLGCDGARHRARSGADEALRARSASSAPLPAGGGARFEVRGFVGPPALYEDPVTGSLNAGLAEWLIGSGRAPERYVAAQGTRLGRAGRVRSAAKARRSGSAALGDLHPRRRRCCDDGRPRAGCARARSSGRRLSQPRCRPCLVRGDFRRHAGAGRAPRHDGDAQPAARAVVARLSTQLPRADRDRSGGAGTDRPRWFDLDRDAMQAAIATPRLVHWGARTRAIDAAVSALRALGFDPGPRRRRRAHDARAACCVGASRCPTTAAAVPAARCRC